MSQTRVNTPCNDPAKQPMIPPKDPPSNGLPAGGQPGQVLSVDDEGNPVWVAGGSGGGNVTLYNTTGQSGTGGMTQKAITDELNGKATATSVNALTQTVNNKADQTSVDALTQTVNTKADATNVPQPESDADFDAFLDALFA